MRKVGMSEFLKKERVAVLCLAKLQQSWLVLLIVVVFSPCIDHKC